MVGCKSEDAEGEDEIKPGAKEGSLLFHTFMHLMVSQVSSRLLSFFLNVLVARRLTREQFGVCVRTFFPLHHVLLMLLFCKLCSSTFSQRLCCSSVGKDSVGAVSAEMLDGMIPSLKATLGFWQWHGLHCHGALLHQLVYIKL